MILAWLVNVYLLATLPRRIAAQIRGERSNAKAVRAEAKALVEPLMEGLRTRCDEIMEMARGELRRAEELRLTAPESDPEGAPEGPPRSEEEDEPTLDDATQVFTPQRGDEAQ